MLQWEVLAAILGGSASLIGSVWFFRSWFAHQFARIYDKMDKMERGFTDKLEYHERHDDRRFSELTNQLWEVRLQQAVTGKAFDRESSPIVTRTTRPQTTRGEQS